MNKELIEEFTLDLAKWKRYGVIHIAVFGPALCLFVLFWPAASPGAPMTSTWEVAKLAVRGMLPILLVVLFLWSFVAIYRASATTLMRRLNEFSTVEIIEVTESLPPGEGRSLAAELLWMRAAFNLDAKARDYLLGNDWRLTPSAGPVALDDLRAKLADRRLRPSVGLIAFTVVCFAMALLSIIYDDLERINASSALPAWMAYVPNASVFILVSVFIWHRITVGDGERQVHILNNEELLFCWISGSPFAHKVLRERARRQPELRDLGMRCGWKILGGHTRQQ